MGLIMNVNCPLHCLRISGIRNPEIVYKGQDKIEVEWITYK